MGKGKGMKGEKRRLQVLDSADMRRERVALAAERTAAAMEAQACTAARLLDLVEQAIACIGRRSR
jgi:hypothetical protein